MSGVFVLMRDQQAGAPQRSELKAQLMYATAIDAQQTPTKHKRGYRKRASNVEREFSILLIKDAERMLYLGENL